MWGMTGVELFTALQIDIAVSKPFAEFLMKTYIADERRVFSLYLYDRPLTDICTISQSDANTCVYIHATDGQFSIATLKRMTLNYVYILYIRRYTHIILYRFSSP